MQKKRLIGLSTSFYASKGLSLYEFVSKTVDLDFNVVEFGAAHTYEHNIHNTLLKIKKDFFHVNFTVHTLFPPLKKRTWFNPANGLSEVNKEIVDGLFSAASIVEALFISIHAPIFYDVALEEKLASNFYKPVPGKSINEAAGKRNFIQLMEYISNKTAVTGIELTLKICALIFQIHIP